MVISGPRKRKIILSKNWFYSRTTLKYLYQFLREVTGFSTSLKKEVEKLIKEELVLVKDLKENVKISKELLS